MADQHCQRPSPEGTWAAILVPTTLFVVENIASLTHSLIHSKPKLDVGQRGGLVS